MNGRAILFGPFRLLAEQRMLLEGDKPVRLGSRAFDILAALIERAGEVVGKEELMARAWPQTFVEEANLKIQVSALRRALGDGQGGNRFVVTVIGRGYNFVAPVRVDEPSRSQPPQVAPSVGVHNLPLTATRMIGRAEAVEALISRLSRQRLVTIVGPGGIGKTTAALAVAERVITEYENGVWLIDLASLADARLVPSAVATVLSLQIPAEDPINGLVAAVRDNRMLLLLDNCEHVIDEVARLATALIGGAKDVDILATSRESLRVAGENEYRLGPLGSPPASSGLTAAEAATFPAVQLFVERVTAIVEDFALTDENTELVLELCRGLDGLPLAIEFAAPGVEVLGLEGLVARLKDSLPLLGSRRRGRVQRHRTMRAVIDWSYGLLGEDEQLFFRALSIFSGGFTVEAAAAVVIDSATTGCEAIDRLADLVTKSLVVADVSGTNPRFRLLETTRAFAIEKLDESGERRDIARRHAAYYRQFFERAAAEAPVRATSDWLADYTQDVDNLRAALDWAFSSGGEASTGVALTAAALPLWIRLSLLEECCRRARQALGVAPTENPREAMQLQAALGASTPEASEMVAAFTKVLDMAKRLDDVEYQLRALWGLYYYYTGIGRFRTAQPFALEFHSLSLRGSDRNDQMFGKSMVAVAEHYVGDQVSARSQLEQLLTQGAAGDLGRDVVRFRYVVRFGMDFRLQVTVFLARVLWLQGFADQAMRMAEQSLQEADATGHAISQCFVLALASCPISFWVGDRVAAAKYTAKLVELSRQHALPHWAAFGARFEQVLVIKAGDRDGGSRRRPSRREEVTAPNFSFRSLSGLTQLAEALGQAGRTTEGLAALEADVGQFEDGCFSPELIRLKGELTMQQDVPGAAGFAEALLRQALDGAREQGALSWELRAATSLARLLRTQDRPADAIACLRPIYDRFTEGFGTADLVAAKQILDQANDPGTIR
ncbi:winged helix-turn-helix domain-containing protein [Bradyrhizobium sp. SRL28]|uniref:ATP-binding protein n=1 Tax=Bradyrhizobium sp. SRL28 TaxID=2836178 RepID=UPI001BDE8ED1|nr:winged helix-turn-helix domain-containing protein [Bradyrhizobium sp. SRL28]MBT1514070.1 winged helix-turn-helix domain-containing protein [Bradyrhizobium sp. SRL28]